MGAACSTGMGIKVGTNRIGRGRRRVGWALVAVAVVASVLVSTPASAAIGPVVTITSPEPHFVSKSDTVVVGFDFSSTYPIETIRLGGNTSGYQYLTPAQAGCDASGLGCRVTATRDPGYRDGEDDLEIQATDINGGSSATATVPIVWDLRHTSAVLYAPSAGQTLRGIVTLTAVGVDLYPYYYSDYVDFYVDGVRLNDTGHSPVNGFYSFDWDTRNWDNGQHLISVGGFDGNHDDPGTPITVTVNNPVATRTTVAATRASISGTTSVAFTATVRKTLGNSLLAGRTVIFTGKTESGSTIYLGTRTTNAYGTARVTYALTQPTLVTASTSASGDYLASSGKVLVKGTSSAHLSVNRSSVSRYGSFVMTGSASPRRVRNMSLYYRYRPNTYWSWWLDRYTNASGVWRVTCSADYARSITPGYLSLRFSVPATYWRYGATSNTVKIHVT